jgi:hypothetical protein
VQGGGSITGGSCLLHRLMCKSVRSWKDYVYIQYQYHPLRQVVHILMGGAREAVKFSFLTPCLLPLLCVTYSISNISFAFPTDHWHSECLPHHHHDHNHHFISIWICHVCVLHNCSSLSSSSIYLFTVCMQHFLYKELVFY